MGSGDKVGGKESEEEVDRKMDEFLLLLWFLSYDKNMTWNHPAPCVYYLRFFPGAAPLSSSNNAVLEDGNLSYSYFSSFPSS